MAELRRGLAGMSVPCKDRNLTGVPFSEIRRQARSDVLAGVQRHAARIEAAVPGAGAVDRPWVITGHQVEFYHAGVWAKVVAADALARQSNAVAIDLLVDHDHADHFGFDMPSQVGEGQWQRQPVHWAAGGSGDAAVDSVDLPTAEQFEAWDAALAKYPVAHSDTLAFVLAALSPARLEQVAGEGHTYVPWMSKARAGLEGALGLDVHHVPTSDVCTSLAWMLFVRAWIVNAASWSQVYNKHLAAYRAANGIHNDHHPMPDLQRGVRIELPFWIYRMGAERARVEIRRTGNDTVEIVYGDEVIEVGEKGEGAAAWAAARQLDETLAGRGLMIRPRALTLTMFVRLFVSDLFIHGIGGALYDQITNGIMEELFGQAPSYACVSAAWLLPLGDGGKPGEGEADIPGLRQRRHHLEHNPQIGIDAFTARKTDFAELITQRRELIPQIAASLAADRTGGREARREWFRRLHEVNAALHAKAPQVLGKIDEQLAEARLAAERNKVLLWREYYFGLHTMESLRTLVDRIRMMG